MAEVLLVNPRRRRRAPVRRRAAARRPARKKVTRRRRRNPIGPFAKSGNMGYYVSNPRRRKRSKRKRRAVRRTRYRSNPALTMRSVMNQAVIPAAQSAGGAIALDFVWGFVPLPDNIKLGPMRHVAKGLGAIVIGRIAGQVLGRKVGDNMAMGALTVTFHQAFREMLTNFAPQVAQNLAYYSAGVDAGYDPTLGQVGYYVGSPRLTTSGGESVPSPNSELGYYVQEGAGAQY